MVATAGGDPSPHRCRALSRPCDIGFSGVAGFAGVVSPNPPELSLTVSRVLCGQTPPNPAEGVNSPASTVTVETVEASEEAQPSPAEIGSGSVYAEAQRTGVAFRRGSNQGNIQNEKSSYYQSFIGFRRYLEIALFEPPPLQQHPYVPSPPHPHPSGHQPHPEVARLGYRPWNSPSWVRSRGLSCTSLVWLYAPPALSRVASASARLRSVNGGISTTGRGSPGVALSATTIIHCGGW